MIYDAIIIGSGCAGLNTALNLQSHKNILIITKGKLWDCNTFYAQGGVAVSLNEEDVFVHVKDTLLAGSFANNKKAVEMLISGSISCLKEMVEHGMKFDTDENGDIIRAKEGAHSVSRVCHSGGDATGRYIHSFLTSKLENHKNISLLSENIVCDLLFEENKCIGVNVYDGEKFQNIYAKNIVIASGGVGALYEMHTNALTVSGDMHGIILKHDLKLNDMQYLQFHPTVFKGGFKKRKLLLTEALRGEGAFVVDETGERFLFKFDERGELASRDIVSRAIFKHEQLGHKVYLDIRQWDKSEFEENFPTIYSEINEVGNFDGLIPISPAFHYTMGGILCDEYGRVFGTKKLYVVGEASGSGVQGANRLASNSLLEGLVFSKVIAREINKDNDNFTINEKTKVEEFDICKIGDEERNSKISYILEKYVGIVRTIENLNYALKELEKLESDAGYFTKLHIMVAKNIINSALNSKSLGAHYLE